MLASGRLFGEERAFCLKLWPNGEGLFGGRGLNRGNTVFSKNGDPEKLHFTFFSLEKLTWLF